MCMSFATGHATTLRWDALRGSAASRFATTGRSSGSTGWPDTTSELTNRSLLHKRAGSTAATASPPSHPTSSRTRATPGQDVPAVGRVGGPDAIPLSPVLLAPPRTRVGSRSAHDLDHGARGSGRDPPAPVLVSPVGSVPNPSPTYTWNASAGPTQYTLQVYDSAGTRLLQRLYDATAVCVGSVCSKAENLVLALGLHLEGEGPERQGGTWSVAVAFTVIPPAAPVASAPSGPLVNPTPTYTWSASTGATTYLHQVFDSGGVQVFQTAILHGEQRLRRSDLQLQPRCRARDGRLQLDHPGESRLGGDPRAPRSPSTSAAMSTRSWATSTGTAGRTGSARAEPPRTSRCRRARASSAARSG